MFSSREASFSEFVKTATTYSISSLSDDISFSRSIGTITNVSAVKISSRFTLNELPNTPDESILLRIFVLYAGSSLKEEYCFNNKIYTCEQTTYNLHRKKIKGGLYLY